MQFPTVRIGLLTHISRSGSTLLARMLDDYDDICVTTEGELPLELFGVKSYAPISFSSRRKVEVYLEQVLSKTRVASWKLPEEQIHIYSDLVGYPLSGPTFIKLLLLVYKETYKPEAKIVIYKACPLMPWHISESLGYFPQAKFIHLLRDPRAVYHSQTKSIDPFTEKPFSSSAIKTTIDWAKAARVAEVVSDKRMVELKYENLLESPDQTMHDLLQYLELESESKTHQSTSFISRMEPVDKQLHQDISSAPMPEKGSHWRQSLPERDIVLIESCLDELLLAKGYKKIVAKQGRKRVGKYYLAYAIMKQKGLTFIRRLGRVVGHTRDNPIDLLRKIKLKIQND